MAYSLKSPVLIKKYNYRFIDDKKRVYFVIKKQKFTNSHNKFVYSVPLVNEHNGDIRNALLAYTDKNECQQLVVRLNKITHSKGVFNENKDIFVADFSDLDEYKYLSRIVHMPLIVIINSYFVNENPNYEIFYHFNRGKFYNSISK
jgi:hypothetical protein